MIPRLLITTLGRSSQQITLFSLGPDLQDNVTLVVQAHEQEEHEAIHHSVLVLPPWIDNLGATRQWLIDQFYGQKIILLDDDLSLYVRNDPDDWHLSIPTDHQVVEMFRDIGERLDTYAHVGVSGREGQNRLQGEWVDNTRYMRILAYNTAMWPSSIRCDRVNGMSDFDTNLQLLRAGLPSSVAVRWAQGQPSTQTPGGCSENRTHSTHTAEIRRMMEMHGDLVKPRTKVNRSGGEFGTRDELTIYWGRALGAGDRITYHDSPRTNSELIAEVRALETDLSAARERVAELEAIIQQME
jgi:hypothetical protein